MILKKKSTSDKNTFSNIMRKVNDLNFSFAQCQEMVTVPQVKISVHPKIKQIIQKKQVQKYLSNPDPITAEQSAAFEQDVTKWNRDIDSLLNTQFDLTRSTSLLQGQIQSEQVKFCISILKKKNKFYLTASFDAGYASAKKKIETATQVSLLFKNLPIQELMTSQTIEQLNTYLASLLQNLIDNIETYITKKLREKLGRSAINANQMFRIFSKFSGLFFRPRIKSAIEQYQSQLLKTVKDGLNLLDKKYVKKYQNTENRKICKVRDILQNPGQIIWIKQIRIKLEKYEKRIEQILLQNWKQHPQGKEIKIKINALLQNLNPDQLKRAWQKQTNTLIRAIELSKKNLFKLVKKKQLLIQNQDTSRLLNKQRLLNPFRPNQMELSIQGKNLIEYYPFFISLQQSIYSYLQVTQN